MTNFKPQRRTMKIEEISLDEIKEYGKNSRKHSEHQIGQIVESIREFGFTNPILIDEDYTIIAGHGRLAAAKKLAMKTIPIIIISGLSDKQKKAYSIVDNKLALNSTWNLDNLQQELKDLAEMSFDLDMLGFDFDELSDLMMQKDDDIEDIEKEKQDKFVLEIQFATKESMFERYEKLLAEGLIVRHKNG